MPSKKQVPQRPNIIYLISDQHRYQAMSHAGDPNVLTPNMDRLAERGVSFARAYANSPICVPSRATMFTGRHAHAHGVCSNYSTLFPMTPTIAKELRGAGYRTAYMGKWHLAPNYPMPEGNLVHADGKPLSGPPVYMAPEHRGGFEDWFGQNAAHDHFHSYYFRGEDRRPTLIHGYETDGLYDLALDYLRNYDHAQPLFLALSVCPPHGPFQAPERNLRLNPRELKVRPNFADVPAGEKANYARDLGHLLRSYREYLAIYYAMVENLDENIGRLTAFLDGEESFRDTIVVYFSDHGELGGSHGRMYTKTHPHEEAVRIPMIWRWPGKIAPAKRDDAIVSLVDLMPTTLGLAGVPVPQYCQGSDLSALLTGRSAAAPDTALLELITPPRFSDDYLEWRGLVNRQWKYALYEDGRELLFDLQADPYEQNNLAEKAPAALGAMRKELADQAERTGDAVYPYLIRRLK